MDVKKIVLLVGALIIAAVTAFMAKSMFTGAAAPQAVAAPVAPQGPEVLVATRVLPVGTIIDAEAFRYQPWPEGLVQDAYFPRGEGGVDPSSLIGTVVRTEISAGQPVTRGALIRPGERGFLAAALGPGMRAVSVAVSETSGVAGFVFPGDRVDIVLSQEVEGGGDGAPLRVSETIIRNIRVLAVDQRINARDAEGNQVARNTSTVTFEATPRIAEKIAVAQRVGSLSLSLRSLADNTAELERAIAAGEVSVPEGEDPRAERSMLLAVANRPMDGPSTYTVGADVSRFQRSTVPARVSNNDSAPSANGAGPVGVDGQPAGPVVRVARGNNVTVVPVGAR
ncbi:Flp pilus assembly protein CpaB [Sphingosinicella terrae]|uniref:Flp pilus assembly protein CpaB n=1 Tax=Sphingosinicella terrae TaxID=2172047 RepID=UPI000E0D05BF|nr:Flp pilus assembly protein CpaB [Sphingosinicella terrae]